MTYDLCGNNFSTDFRDQSKCLYDLSHDMEISSRDATHLFGSQVNSGIYPIPKTPLGYRAQCQHLKQKRSWWDWKEPFTKRYKYMEHKMGLVRQFQDKTPFPVHSALRSSSYAPSLTHDNLGYQLMDDQIISKTNHGIMKRATNASSRPEQGYFDHQVMDTFNVKEKERIREMTTLSTWYPGVREDIRSNYHFKVDVPRDAWSEETQDYIYKPMGDDDYRQYCPSGLLGVRPQINLHLKRHSYPYRVYKEFVGAQHEGDQKPWYADLEGIKRNWHRGDIQNKTLTDPRHMYKNEPWHDVYVCNREPNLDETSGPQSEATLLCMEPGDGGFKGFEYLTTSTFHNIPETICRGTQVDREYYYQPELLHYQPYNPDVTDPLGIIEHDHETNFWELSTVDDVILPDWHEDVDDTYYWDHLPYESLTRADDETMDFSAHQQPVWNKPHAVLQQLWPDNPIEANNIVDVNLGGGDSFSRFYQPYDDVFIAFHNVEIASGAAGDAVLRRHETSHAHVMDPSFGTLSPWVTEDF